MPRRIAAKSTSKCGNVNSNNSNLNFSAINDSTTKFLFGVAGVLRRHHCHETEPFAPSLIEDYLRL